jgi:hypothetical protein
MSREQEERPRAHAEQEWTGAEDRIMQGRSKGKEHRTGREDRSRGKEQRTGGGRSRGQVRVGAEERRGQEQRTGEGRSIVEGRSRGQEERAGAENSGIVEEEER